MIVLRITRGKQARLVEIGWSQSYRRIVYIEGYAYMIEGNDDIRPHDWLEAEKMVDALLDEGKRDEFQC